MNRNFLMSFVLGCVTSWGSLGCGTGEDVDSNDDIELESSAATSGETVEKASPSDLRIGVYNVMRSSNFPKDDGDRGAWGDRIDGFARIASAVDADIWSMQELLYGGVDQPGRTPDGVKAHLARITGKTWNMAHHGDYGEFIFSVHPIDASGTYGRRILWALIDVGDDDNRENDVAVIDVHLMTDAHGTNLANFVRSILGGEFPSIPPDVPLLVVGDFNNQPSGPRYAAVQAAIGGADVRPIWLGTANTAYTYGGVKYSGGTFTAPRGGNPIDYIFPHLNDRYTVANSFVLSTLVLNDSVLSAAGLRQTDVALHPNQNLVEGVRVECDHFPLVVDLRRTP